ncbi:hypothetical protein [Paraburkholderia sp. SIMBA_030]|uniref:hypothetical protein n=1 Tax=Paraburkholderia sp. SIMBA_030 TaxID=3085773 RepID=UPI003978B2B6
MYDFRQRPAASEDRIAGTVQLDYDTMPNQRHARRFDKRVVDGKVGRVQALLFDVTENAAYLPN